METEPEQVAKSPKSSRLQALRHVHKITVKRGVRASPIKSAAAATRFTEPETAANDARRKALRQLKASARYQLVKRVILNDPHTFRTAPPLGESPARRADYGLLKFGGQATAVPSHFMHLAETRKPFEQDVVYHRRIARMMECHWRMSYPHVLLSVTGIEDNVKLPPKLTQAFSRGIAVVAAATRAWVMTSGLNAGAGSLVGRALADYDAEMDGTALGDTVNLVGIIAWGMTPGRDKLVGCSGELVTLGQESGDRSRMLEPHHTHFLLVDDGTTGTDAWGSELAFRARLEGAIAVARGPRAVMVVHGGERSLHFVQSALENGCSVVLLAESGGAATLIHRFLAAHKAGDKARLAEFDARPELEQLRRIAQLNAVSEKVTSLDRTPTLAPAPDTDANLGPNPEGVLVCAGRL